MANNTRIKIAKDLIETGKLKSFQDIFIYASRTDIAKRMGINYTRFCTLVKNPKRFRYEETYSIAHIFQVSARAISELIHNQIDTRKPEKNKK
jgi:hypothetical protein